MKVTATLFVFVHVEQVGTVLREKRVTQALLASTCQGLRERREPRGSQETQVLKD